MASITENGALHTEASARACNDVVRRFPPLRIADSGKVRVGGQGPCFRPASIVDKGKVRVGGQGPIFR
jgi:hypothetical protein